MSINTHLNSLPLICFYESDILIWSNHYDFYENLDSSNLENFLISIENQFAQKMKIVQINFDLTCAVYILNNWKLIKKIDLTTSIVDLNLRFKPDITQFDFINKINLIKIDIQNGRYYQVNFTSSFSADLSVPIQPYEIFKFYLNKFQPNYPAFLPNKNKQILCYSPELFLEKKENIIITKPIKGTTHNKDPFLNLKDNEKENAELSMIVDLLRNDLQSICNKKVQVTKHRDELKLNYVTHTYSEVSGHTNKNLPEILKNMLPAGSISGCPKKESLFAIHELEKLNRGFYTGCIGWWKNNDFKLNLAIRSFLKTPRNLTYYSGCGIVYDSNPEHEWKEFLLKAKHLDLQNDLFGRTDKATT